MSPSHAARVRRGLTVVGVDQQCEKRDCLALELRRLRNVHRSEQGFWYVHPEKIMTKHRETGHHIQERPLSALDAIFMRRSVRAYTTQKLDEATIRSLLDAAVQAPTAMHLEPWAFVVIQDEATLKRYSDRAKGSWAKEAAKYRDLHAGVDAATGRRSPNDSRARTSACSTTRAR